MSYLLNASAVDRDWFFEDLLGNEKICAFQHCILSQMVVSGYHLKREKGRESKHRGRQGGKVKGRNSVGDAGWVGRPPAGGLLFAGITSLSIDGAQGK